MGLLESGSCRISKASGATLCIKALRENGDPCELANKPNSTLYSHISRLATLQGWTVYFVAAWQSKTCKANVGEGGYLQETHIL